MEGTSYTAEVIDRMNTLARNQVKETPPEGSGLPSSRRGRR